MYRTFGFVGLGLIGGSLARSLRLLYSDCRIIAFSRRTSPAGDISEAIRAGVVSDVVYSLNGLADCDVIFLCAPVEANISYLPTLSGLISPHTLITDVGSVKSGICGAAKSAGISSQFIGGHPMTGSERNGFVNSNALLLENAYYALTPGEGCPLEALQEFTRLVNDMKAIPVVLDPKVHDDAVSAISHVPHLIAAQLVNLVRSSGNSDVMKLLAAGGFKDITRIASSSPALWEGILSSNKEFVLPTLYRYIDLLTESAHLLEADDKSGVAELFDTAGAFRSTLGDRKGVLPEAFALYADIKDETGAIARFATLLAAAGISMKNIGIVHNREFERGVLRIEFYEKNSLEDALIMLRQNGFTIYR